MRIQDGKNSDPGWKKFGSGINIQDPQHCLQIKLFCELKARVVDLDPVGSELLALVGSGIIFPGPAKIRSDLVNVEFVHFMQFSTLSASN